MASSRSKETTIPEGKDPLAGVSYSQPKPQPPINGLISDTSKVARPEPSAGPTRADEPKAAGPTPRPRKEKITVVVPDDLLERVRNAAWWKRKSLATLAEEGLRLVVERLERQNGGPFEPREEPLRPGRPQDSRNHGGKVR
jgi:hypothetical protein